MPVANDNKNQKHKTSASNIPGKVATTDEIPEVSVLKEIPQNIRKEILNIIPEEVAKKYRIAFFDKKNGLIQAVMVNPQDFEALNVLRFIAEKEKLDIEVYSCSPKIFSEIVGKYTTTEKALAEAVKSFEGEEELEDLVIRENIDEEDKKGEVLQDAPVSKLVQVIITHAVDGRASDVHVEPVEHSYRVRFRVDGILHSSLTLPRDVGRAVVSRIKILSNLKIDEKRKPQDGRFSIADEGRKIDFRVSTLPVVEGEKVVMRVLDKEDWVFDLKSLGITGKNFILAGESDSSGLFL
jgi:type IV pilus assembly protein PilB